MTDRYIVDENGAVSPLPMSNRDQIAMHAMQGMLAHGHRYKPRPGDPDNWHKAISKEAYEIADAMLGAGKTENVVHRPSRRITSVVSMEDRMLVDHYTGLCALWAGTMSSKAEERVQAEVNAVRTEIMARMGGKK